MKESMIYDRQWPWPGDPAARKYYRREFGVRTDRQIQKAERKRLKREAKAAKPRTESR